jgi:hypothetical protein
MSISKISREDILDALGIERGGGWLGPAAAAFGAGLLIGGAVALLLAPKSGAELRDHLANKVRSFRERAEPDGTPTRPNV